MRSALRGLTTRGRCFLAAAVAAALSALLLGESDLLRVAVLLAAVPVLSAAAVARTRYQLRCSRVLQPQRVSVGGTARVVLRLVNTSRLPTGTLLLEDRLPYALGSRPRLVLERLAGHKASSVAYTVRADVRGKYEVGPLVVRLTDPFGLCELTRAFPNVDTLRVAPRVVPLSPVRLTGEYSGAGESHARSVAVHGEDDAATREYRYGDDLRRVHWRSTAKAGELMVRREEQPWESRATVLLDTRLRAHRGEGPTASFEWAVSAAASIAVHLRHCGYRMRLVTETGTDLDSGTGESGGSIGLLLDHLAEVKLSQRGDLTQVVRQVHAREDGGLIVAVLGMMRPEEAEAVAALRTSGTTCVGFLLDAAGWLRLPAEQRAAQDRAYQTSALTLLRAGWRVIGVPHGSSFAALWPQAGHGARGVAVRASLADTITGTVR
ncbi:membrane protein [Actinocatenispora thailandica]|uniref:Membrane protein n=1 Tax=Actinocatenispora thailandica TaxID=227318 RepID=A0A7R7HWC5_9ACTN|nr:DUF58 domain-containing protein [Actinocatenispora thailandica]BCJ34942.1 membrane protein [Actinocatenispora thailandica]